MKKQKLVLAAVAGLAAGVGAGAQSPAAKPENVQCWGVNGCGGQAKCSVTTEDLAAVKKLMGDVEYQKKFGKSEVHSCAGKAKCGGSMGVLNWMELPGDVCKARGGLLIDGKTGARVARKA